MRWPPNSAYPCSDSGLLVLQVWQRKIKTAFVWTVVLSMSWQWFQSGMMRSEKCWDTWVRCLNWPKCLQESWVMELSEPFKPSRRAASSVPILIAMPGERSWGDQSGIEGPEKSQAGVRNGGSELLAHLCLYFLLRHEMCSFSAEEPRCWWVIMS